MKPAKDQSTAQLVKTVAGAAIALKMVDPAAYAGKIKGSRWLRYRDPIIYADTFSYLTISFCVSLSLVPLSVTISMYIPERKPVIDILSSL